MLMLMLMTTEGEESEVLLEYAFDPSAPAPSAVRSDRAALHALRTRQDVLNIDAFEVCLVREKQEWYSLCQVRRW